MKIISHSKPPRSLIPTRVFVKEILSFVKKNGSNRRILNHLAYLSKMDQTAFLRVIWPTLSFQKRVVQCIYLSIMPISPVLNKSSHILLCIKVTTIHLLLPQRKSFPFCDTGFSFCDTASHSPTHHIWKENEISIKMQMSQN